MFIVMHECSLGMHQNNTPAKVLWFNNKYMYLPIDGQVHPIVECFQCYLLLQINKRKYIYFLPSATQYHFPRPQHAMNNADVTNF